MLLVLLSAMHPYQTTDQMASKEVNPVSGLTLQDLMHEVAPHHWERMPHCCSPCIGRCWEGGRNSAARDSQDLCKA